MKLVVICSTILSWFASKALATLEEQVSSGALRGANNNNNIEMSDDLDRLDHRELQSFLTGSTAHSLSFSVASAQAAGSACFDPYIHCLEWGAAAGDSNAFGIATSSEHLWHQAWCQANAEAYTQACTFTKVDGDIKVETIKTNGYKEVSLNVVLKTATKTLAYAASSAIAQSYVNAGAMSYTNVEAYCTAVKNKSPFCASGTAATDLTQVATAAAAAKGQAHALGRSGSVTKQNVAVSARGASLDFLNGYIAAYAKSWSYADAGAVASTYATAFAAVATSSFAQVCVAEHEKICSDNQYKGKGVCEQTADVACTTASATGSGYAVAAANAVALAFVEAESKAETKVQVSANLDCENNPTLTWSSTKAGVDQICGVH